MEKKDVHANKVSDSDVQTLPFLGSKAWADLLLKVGIASLRDFERVPESRLQEFLHEISLLDRYGWSWHSRILRAWAHKYWWNLRPLGVLRPSKMADPKVVGGASS